MLFSSTSALYTESQTKDLIDGNSSRNTIKQAERDHKD